MKLAGQALITVTVVGVLFVAVSLALVAAGLAANAAWDAAVDVAQGDASTTEVKTEFLSLASLLLESVVFYLVGVGLYSLFVQPVAGRIPFAPTSLADLEVKVISVVIVILATTFLERFTGGQPASETRDLAIALALAVPALVLFQWYLTRAGKESAPS